MCHVDAAFHYIDTGSIGVGRVSIVSRVTDLKRVRRLLTGCNASVHHVDVACQCCGSVSHLTRVNRLHVSDPSDDGSHLFCQQCGTTAGCLAH